MTSPPTLFAFFTYVAVMFHCNADQYPPLTGLSYKWLDGFTVRVSWKKPAGLPEDSQIQFLVKSSVGNVDGEILMWSKMCYPGRFRNFNYTFLTKEVGSDHWTFTIWTINSHNGSKESGTPASITVYSPKPQAEVAKDFKCFIYSDEMKCSWIPENPLQNLTLSYRTCEDSIKSTKRCEQPYSTGERTGCNLLINTTPDHICILVETEDAMSTFKPVLVAPPPQLSLREERDYLKLTWTLPAIGPNCWTTEICYQQCNKLKECQNTSVGVSEKTVPYDKSCRYEFQSRVRASSYCTSQPILSDFSEVVIYGTTAPPDETLTVIAIVIPLILFICVILSCYCFRRHSAIICPVIPDPSVIFKEMIMNANKERKPTPENLYTPVPEPTCKIVVSENTALQQNS